MENDKLTWDDYCFLHTCVLYVRTSVPEIDKSKLDKLQVKLIDAMEREEQKEFNEIRSHYA